VVDGKTESAYNNIYELNFSPDSQHVAYAAEQGKIMFAVIDGKPSSTYDGVDKPVFSPDSKHVAYVTIRRQIAKGMKFCVMVINPKLYERKIPVI